MQNLLAMLSKETHAGTLDNICGAISKMIILNVLDLPIDQVVPTLMMHLPLKFDHQENDAVVKALYGLYHDGRLKGRVADVTKIITQIYHKEEYGSDGKNI